MAQKIYLKKSSVEDRTPQANSLEFGELTINYASGVGKSFLATKKHNGQIAKFHEDAYNEATYASKGDVSNIESQLTTFATKDMLKAVSGAAVTSAYTMAVEYVNNALSGFQMDNYLTVASAASVFEGYDGTLSEIQSKLGNYALSSTVKTELSTISQTIEDNEYVISQAFNEINDRLTSVESNSGNYLTVESATQMSVELSNSVSEAKSAANSALKYASGVSATVLNNYATKDLVGKVSANTFNSAKTYVDNNFVSNSTYNSYTGDVSNQIAEAKTNASNALKYASGVSATVLNNYATKDLVRDVSANTYNRVTAWTETRYITSANAVSNFDSVKNDVSNLNNKVTGFSATVVSNYATKDLVGTISANTFNSAKTYVDGKIGDLEIGNYITSADAVSKFSELELATNNAGKSAQTAYKYAEGVSGTVKSGYWNSATTANRISQTSANTFNSAKTYVDGNFVKNDTYNGFTSTTNSNISTLAKSAMTVSANVIALSAAVATKLSSVYKYKGTKADASQLPTTGNEDGDVWNVVAASGNTPAGTNYAWVKEGNGGHWDALGGTIDLSGFFTSAAADTLKTELQSADNALGKKIDAVSGTVKATYWTSATTKDKIDAAITTAINSAITNSTTNLTNLIDAVSGTVNDYKSDNDSFHNSVKSLSSWTVTNAATHNEVKSASANSITSANGYTDRKIAAYGQSASATFVTNGRFAEYSSTTLNSINNIKNNYALSSTVRTELSAINVTIEEDEEVWAASYTDLDRRIRTVSSTTSGLVTYVSANTFVTNLTNSINSTNNKLGTLSASVVNNYATDVEASSYAAAALGNAMAYTDSKISGLSIGNYLTVTSANSIVTTLNSSINAAKTTANSAFNFTRAVCATTNDNFALKSLVRDVSANTYNRVTAWTETRYITSANTVAAINTINSNINKAQTAANSAFNFTRAVCATTNDNFALKSLVRDVSANTYNRVTAWTETRYITSANTVAAINTINSNVNKAQNAANSAFNFTQAVCATTNNNFALKTLVRDVSANTYNAATAWTNTNALSRSSAATLFQNVDSSINNVTNRLTGFSATVMSDYATETEASDYAAAALGNAMAYTDSKIGGLSIGNYLLKSSAATIFQDVYNKFSNYSLTSHTHTAAQVGALPTGTTLDGVPDGSTRKLSNYSLTSHTHSDLLTRASAATLFQNVDNKFTNYSLTSHTHSQYSLTSHTHSQYSLTSHTHSQYSLTSHTHSDLLTRASAATLFQNTNNSINNVNNLVTGLSASVITNISSVFKYKGSVNNAYNLPANASTGDTYNVVNASGNTPAGTNWTWNGTGWDPLAGTVDLSPYLLRSSAATLFQNVDNKFTNYSLTSHTHSQYSLTSHTHSQYSLTSHTHSNYSLTSHTHSDLLTRASAATLFQGVNNSIATTNTNLGTLSASVVNNYATEAKASSYAAAALSNAMDYTDSKLTEGNYLTRSSAATLFQNVDNKFTNYSLTSHTHSQYSLTSHTHSNYSLTSHTHSNYSLTSHTHSDLLTRASAATLFQAVDNKFSNYSLTSHTHSQYSLTSHTHSNYSLTSHTHSNYSLTSHTHSDLLTRASASTLFTNVNNAIAGCVKKTGDTMTGLLTMQANQYSDAYSGALNMSNSNIYGLNGIFTADAAENASEGINFYKDTTHVDSLWAAGGKLNFTPNRQLGTNGTTYEVYHTGNLTLSNYALAANSGKVIQENVTTAAYRPLLFSSNNNAAQASIPTATVTAQTYFNKEIYAQPSTGELGATQMKVGGHVTLKYNTTTEALDFIFS